MESKINYYDDFQKESDEQKPIRGYKIFIVGDDNKYYSLVYNNPMEFKEGEEYFETGDMSVGNNSFCFGTQDDLDILAFSGFDTPIAVGIITVYPPYFLYDDNYRDCCDIGYSQHIKIERIMDFEEVCKYMEKYAHRSEILIRLHKLDDEYIKYLIDKFAHNSYFLKHISSSWQVSKSQVLKDYIEEKRRVRKDNN